MHERENQTVCRYIHWNDEYSSQKNKIKGVSYSVYTLFLNENSEANSKKFTFEEPGCEHKYLLCNIIYVMGL